jgi:serine/threonine-protein kinase
VTSPLGKRFGRYDLLAHLASGGMAEIFLARMSGSAGFQKLVVIKRLPDRLSGDPEYVEMFLDEARINARLSHVNVVQVIELGQVDGKYFMAMEYVPGLSVSQIGRKCTERFGDVPQAVACGIVAQAAVGLHYAHECVDPDTGKPLGIVHRDVSPQNLILTFQGNVKVVDFGIARAEGRQARTMTGKVKGKAAYLSPEQCQGLPMDRRTDIFALGIVLYELCTARRLFKRATPAQTFDAIVLEPVIPPRRLNPKIEPDVEAVILRALEKKPRDRFPTAAAMHEVLADAMRRSGMLGGPADLERFMEATFKAEMEAQQAIIEQAQRSFLEQGLRGTDPTFVAPIAQVVAPTAPSIARVAAGTTAVTANEIPMSGPVQPLPPTSAAPSEKSTPPLGVKPLPLPPAERIPASPVDETVFDEPPTIPVAVALPPVETGETRSLRPNPPMASPVSPRVDVDDEPPTPRPSAPPDDEHDTVLEPIDGPVVPAAMPPALHEAPFEVDIDAAAESDGGDTDAQPLTPANAKTDEERAAFAAAFEETPTAFDPRKYGDTSPHGVKSITDTRAPSPPPATPSPRTISPLFVALVILGLLGVAALSFVVVLAIR